VVLFGGVDPKTPWWGYLLALIVFGLIWNMVFNLFFNKVLLK